MPILVGIDGTGDNDDKTYAANFVKSFVSIICKKPSLDAMYYRGPNTPGMGLMGAIHSGHSFIIQRSREMASMAQVLLTGYSRGGAGVIEIARLLQNQKITVQAMLLFDAVDRHPGIDASRIPPNVLNVYHVRRDPSTKSRVSFGNCGLAYGNPTKYQQDFFKCTHGGMGGTPWKLTPGKTPDDFVDESGAGIKAADPKTGFIINTGLRAIAPLPLKPLIGHGKFDATRYLDGVTNVKYRDDERISGEVWNAVQPFIKNHGFM